MSQPSTVHIVMHGGWPDAAFSNEEQAKRFVEMQIIAERNRAAAASRPEKKVPYYITDVRVDEHVAA
jgi:hypothetical protein